VTTTAGNVGRTLLDFVEAQLAALAVDALPGFELPGILMGHEVGPDVRADLLFTLGLFHDCGRTEVAGANVADAIIRLLAGVHGKRTHTFYSYRVAETVARFGPFEDNPVLAPLTSAERNEVAQSVDSTDWLDALDNGLLPRNYAAVLARCENARRSLGLLDDSSTLEDLLARARALLGGHLDDSNAQIGRYDIYTVDLPLFCEPMAETLGPPWRAGARKALALVDRVATRDGAAVAWGRSTGVLATCHTIELGGLAARHDVSDDPARWIARAAHVAAELGGWFDAGWVTAHRHRSSDPYRGLDRRLQLTLDCLGKLADTAQALLAMAEIALEVDEEALFPARNEMVWFDEERAAGVWTFRSRDTAFALPLVGGTTSDYVPAPRLPGLFEVPVGSDLVTGTPLILHKGVKYTSGGLPAAATQACDELHARYDGFPEAGQLEPGPEARTFPGTREVTWRVDGRTLHVEDHLTFDEPPHALALQVTEAAGRPLQVDFECDVAHTTAVIDVDGIAEYRSCWGELPRLHQIDVRPTASARMRWSITPVLRTVSTAVGALYSDSLYASLTDRVRVTRLPHSAATNAVALAKLTPHTDQFHLHWPEWLLIGDVVPHQALIDGLRAGRVRIVWTQHNLEPHSKDPAMGPVYEAWARAADLVIHHSDWGRQQALSRYQYGLDTRHVVIAHGHFGAAPLVRPDAAARTEVERELGLRPAGLRIGVFGAPRAEKDVELAMRAVARSRRDDIELLVLSLRGDEDVPDDPRVVARPYEHVARDVYDRRFAAIDALLMPFDPEGQMLTTGTIGDALAFGLPTIASSWAFLSEALDDAAITYGATEDDLVACLDGLDRAALDAAADAARDRRSSHDWTLIAEQTYLELDRLGSAQH